MIKVSKRIIKKAGIEEDTASINSSNTAIVAEFENILNSLMSIAELKSESPDEIRTYIKTIKSQHNILMDSISGIMEKIHSTIDILQK